EVSLLGHLWNVRGATQDGARTHARAGLALKRHLTVHDRIIDAHGTLHQPSLAAGEVVHHLWLGGLDPQPFEIIDDHVRCHALAEQATVVEPHDPGWHERQAPVRFL